MSNAQDPAIIGKIEKEILEAMSRKFARQIELLAPETTEEFKKVMALNAGEAVEQFVLLMETLQTPIDAELSAIFSALAIKALNSVLALDYPFIAVLVHGNDNLLYFAALERAAIPGAHDLVNPGLIPIIKINGSELQGKKISFVPTGVRYLNPDM